MSLPLGSAWVCDSMANGLMRRTQVTFPGSGLKILAASSSCHLGYSLLETWCHFEEVQAALSKRLCVKEPAPDLALAADN